MQFEELLLFPNINTYFIDYVHARTGNLTMGTIQGLNKADAIDRWIKRYGYKTELIHNVEDCGCSYTNFQRALDIRNGRVRIDPITGLEMK